MPRSLAITTAAIMVWLCGCSANPASMVMSGAQAGLSVMKGAEARVFVLRGTGSVPSYGAVRLADVTTDVERLCSPEVVNAVRAAMMDALTERQVKEAFPGSGKSILLKVSCRFFKEKPLIGKEARLDLLVTLLDGEDKMEIGQVYIEGLSDSFRAHGKGDLAKKNADELMDFLIAVRKGR